MMKPSIFYPSFQKYHVDKVALALPSANQPISQQTVMSKRTLS